MKTTAKLFVVAAIVVASYYIGHHYGYVDGVLDTTVEQMMARPTYL